MTNIDALKLFLQELQSKLDNFEDAEKLCHNTRHGGDSYLKVLATAILCILVEINNYLAYYDEYIAKRFGGISVKDEVLKVHDLVFAPLQKDITFLFLRDDSHDLVYQTVMAIGSMVERWDSFEKTDLEKTIASISSESV